MMQLFCTSLAIKFDPDEIETFCFLLLKAEIYAIQLENCRVINTLPHTEPTDNCENCRVIGRKMPELY
jgi:hypothetical protein